MTKKGPSFGLILCSATLILVAAFIFLSPPAQQRAIEVSDSQSSISTDIYESSVNTALKNTWTINPDTAFDQDKAAVSSALESLLNMRVPAERKETHLDLVLTMQKIKQGLASNPQAANEALVHLVEMKNNNEWLQN